MATPVWQPGRLYPKGSLVQPSSAPAAVAPLIANPNFELGDVNWTKGATWTIVNSPGSAFQGSWVARFSGSTAANLDSTSVANVTPGTSITANCMVDQGPASSGNAGAGISLVWLDAADVLVSVSAGVQVTSTSGGAFKPASVTGIAPAGAAKVFVRISAFGNGSGVFVDNVSWNYIVGQIPDGLVYKAVQTGLGTSAATEPAWPATLGLTVVDNTVIWEAVQATRVVWEANPMYVSGATEPVWPAEPDAVVADGTLIWQAITRRVTDPNCPNNGPTIILASHVFNVDGDIVRACAVNNPLDWTTESDACFLPTGMQGQNANDAKVVAEFRKNLGVMNASSWQLWLADPDPEAMDILDKKNGIGSIYPRAATSVGDDLFYLDAEGVRNVTGAAGNNSNMTAAVGAPVDDLLQTALALAIESGMDPTFDPVSTYYPGLGQYMLAIPIPAADAWTPINESDIAYTFSGDGPTMSGSIVSYTGASTASWAIALPTGTRNIRIVCLNWSQGDETFQTPGTFYWPEGGAQASQTNTAPDIGTAWTPTPLDITVTIDGDTEVPSLEFSFLNENTTSYQFQVFVQGTAVEGSTNCFVATKMRTGSWTWSRYVFPFAISEFCLYENDLYFRHGDAISVFDDTVQHDELDATGTLPEVLFGGMVQWNWQDMGNPGTTKHMQSFDLIAEGLPVVSFGYNQRNKALFTDGYSVDPDTLVDGPIQYEVTAPSISVRVEFLPGAPWSLSSFIGYFDDLGATV